ncbi:hypothetical protein F5J12DRAFT_847495 [Pisolithus orientalis]|uniref:uncharacterized protein n=1 Tax=Pisolithus orientalis TaxID=936130 RepID=UPI0022259060|nr:uncharacterized protein F5J12DRAFT_847495 [Pisolithus orientalis]KAI5999310.1 hypothetical protein F5J12DRAFT_847495 [Pisolithus orientalis]
MAAQAHAETEFPELVRFREEWKEEVRQRRAARQQTESEPPDSQTQRHAPPLVGTSQLPPASTTACDSSDLPVQPLSQADLHNRVAVSVSRASLYTSNSESNNSSTLTRAVGIYRSAVQHEQEGRLDEALKLYSQAFRLEQNVDRTYFWEEQRSQQLAIPSPLAADLGGLLKATFTGKSKVNAAQGTTIIKADTKDKYCASGALAKLIANFPAELAFTPEDEREGVALNVIPDELLLNVLRSLDTTTIERFAAVCRKARVLSLDSSIWKDFIYMAYKPPQIPDADSVNAIIKRFNADYRQTYIEQPRLRLDGVYISVCHYVRRGVSDYAWVNSMHLVTYHRYLRFFADGTVLSLLANEEHTPQNVIPVLKPSLRMKGFTVGNWQLDGSIVRISNLHSPHYYPSSRYNFQMSLALQSKPLGRWNRLEVLSYESVNVETGEVAPFVLKHERPFWFSRVKSYPGYH